MARKSAEERREEIVEIAMRHFAEGGFHGTSTEAIASEAGISQPYLFRLFGTKRDLFLACVDRCHMQVRVVFEEAAAGAADGDRLQAMGQAYKERLLPDRHALLLQVQGYATSEPVIRAHVRENFGKLIRIVAGLAGVGVDETWAFFADGMLLNVVAMLELDWMPER
jgi:AcrR family transcriptional regulator